MASSSQFLLSAGAIVTVTRASATAPLTVSGGFLRDAAGRLVVVNV